MSAPRLSQIEVTLVTHSNAVYCGSCCLPNLILVVQLFHADSTGLGERVRTYKQMGMELVVEDRLLFFEALIDNHYAPYNFVVHLASQATYSTVDCCDTC